MPRNYLFASPKSYAIFIFLLVFSPLAFGTVEQWSLTIMEGGSLWVLFLLCRERNEGRQLFYKVPGIVPLIALWSYCIIQLVPLPSGIVHIISPKTYKVYAETIGSIEPVKWMTLSINKKATMLEWFRFTAYLSFYIVTVQLLAGKELLGKTVKVVITFSSGLAVLGIIQYLFYNGKIYWIRNLTQGGHPFGPFVNKNHYAGFMEMVLPIMLSFFVYFKPQVRYRSLRERILKILTSKDTDRHILMGFFSILVAASVFLSLSRGGVISLCFSMIFFSLMVAWKKGRNKNGIFIIGFFLTLFLVVTWLGWGPIVQRFENIRDVRGNIVEVKPTLWNDSLRLIRDFPLTGTGFGTFVSSYQKYRTFPGELTADHAENDYIELLAEGGIISFLLSGWFLCSVLYRSYKTFLQRRDSCSIYLSIGSAAGLLAILIHSAVDFNLHIGSNGLYFFFLCGLLVSATHTRLQEKLHTTYLEAIQPFPLSKLGSAAAVLLIAITTVNMGALAAEISFSGVKSFRLDEQHTQAELLKIKKRAYRASLFDPFDARYRHALGKVEVVLSNNDSAIRYFTKAVERDCMNGGYLQDLGLAYAARPDFDKAERLLRLGTEYDSGNALRHRTYAAWLISQGRREEGLKNMELTMGLVPEQTREYITLLVLNGYNDEEIQKALPQRMFPYITFGSYLHRTGNESMAAQAYLSALNFMDNDKSVNTSYFYKIADFFKGKKDYDTALKIIQKGLAHFPDDAEMQLVCAGLYEQLGITYRAIEEYRKVLLIDPVNPEARNRLNALTSNKE